ncbi:glycoprotein [Ralstonia insidiosa]|uniref:glycoprotein n=1 Tax=Ralstonia insidiosa TaxID=190721 RepID=UPI00313447FC
MLRRSTRLLIAVATLAALVTLPRAHASTQLGAPLHAAASAPAAAEPSATTSATAAKTGKEGKAPTCQAIMQRLSGSLAGTPSRADKPGAVMVDFEKSGVTMACSHSDAVAIPVPGNAKPR